MFVLYQYACILCFTLYIHLRVKALILNCRQPLLGAFSNTIQGLQYCSSNNSGVLAYIHVGVEADGNDRASEQCFSLAEKDLLALRATCLRATLFSIALILLPRLLHYPFRASQLLEPLPLLPLPLPLLEPLPPLSSLQQLRVLACTSTKQR
jgi:hypothetical protein